MSKLERQNRHFSTARRHSAPAKQPVAGAAKSEEDVALNMNEKRNKKNRE